MPHGRLQHPSRFTNSNRQSHGLLADALTTELVAFTSESQWRAVHRTAGTVGPHIAQPAKFIPTDDSCALERRDSIRPSGVGAVARFDAFQRSVSVQRGFVKSTTNEFLEDCTSSVWTALLIPAVISHRRLASEQAETGLLGFKKTHAARTLDLCMCMHHQLFCNTREASPPACNVQTGDS